MKKWIIDLIVNLATLITDSDKYSPFH